MKRILFLLMIVVLLAACEGEDQPTAVLQPTTAAPTPTLAQAAPTTAVQPTQPAAANSSPPTATSQAAATAAPTSAAIPSTGEEAILIQEPGPGWRLTTPIHVSGIANPAFEQNLVVRLLLDDGTEIALMPTTIAADLGQRGPFSVDIPFTITGERQAFLQVYTTSARDGGITHLSSVGLTIADSGPENRPPFTPMNERIMITQPTLNAVVSGGTVHIEGVALASFEQTLLVELLDEAGVVIGSAPVIVNAPDFGMFGAFQIDIPYPAAVTGPGRIVVRDLSPAFGGDVHVASVEIRFE